MENGPVETTGIAFIGTGGMGQGMARCLLEAGYALTVCNRTVAKAQPLVDTGAALAITPREAATGAGVIISMVGDDRDSREVWLGTDGVLAGRPKRHAIAIESSTLSFEWVRELAEAVTAAGLSFIDSPVTGGRRGAVDGTLTLLVGAQEADLARARPVMDAYSQEIVHFGPVGAGTAYKLMVNSMVGVQAVALAEGLLLAEKTGLDMAQVIRALAGGAAASPIVKAYAERMVSGDHDEVTNFLARWMHKDMAYALTLAAEMGQSMPTSAVATQVFQMMQARRLADKNVTAVIETLR
jgi:3-hydroxyisobutyrate dehydrogenase